MIPSDTAIRIRLGHHKQSSVAVEQLLVQLARGGDIPTTHARLGLLVRSLAEQRLALERTAAAFELDIAGMYDEVIRATVDGSEAAIAVAFPPIIDITPEED